MRIFNTGTRPDCQGRVRGVSLFRTYGALFEEDVRITTAADRYAALAVAWILRTANAVSLMHRAVSWHNAVSLIRRAVFCAASMVSLIRIA